MHTLSRTTTSTSTHTTVTTSEVHHEVVPDTAPGRPRHAAWLLPYLPILAQGVVGVIVAQLAP
jgi:hypothetical protein